MTPTRHSIPLVAVLSNHPAPYREPTFREIHARGKVRIFVLHAAPLPHNHSYWDLDVSGYPLAVLDGQGGLSKIPGLIARLSSLRPDAIVIPGHNTALSRAALSFALIRQTPVVYSADTIANPTLSAFRQHARKAMARVLAPICSAYWVPGKASRKFLWSSGIEDKRIFEGCYCIDQAGILAELERAQAGRQTLRSRLGCGSEEFVFLFVGEMLPTRQIPRLIRVFASLGHLKAGLILVGGGGEIDIVRDQIRRTKARVHLVDPVPFRELAAFYASADAYVHPGHEPYSLALLQAAVCGLPTISTENVGAAEDVLRDGVSGIVVPEGQDVSLRAALNAMMSDPRRAESMGKEGKRLSSPRTPAWAASQLEEAVLCAVRGHAVPAGPPSI